MPVILQTTVIFTHYSMASFTADFFIFEHTNTNFIYWSSEIWFCYQNILDAKLFLQPHHVPTGNTHSLNYKKKKSTFFIRSITENMVSLNHHCNHGNQDDSPTHRYYIQEDVLRVFYCLLHHQYRVKFSLFSLTLSCNLFTLLLKPGMII